MPSEITMPQLSDTMTEGKVVKWHKKEGDFVARDENLMPLPPLIRSMTSLPADRFGLRDRGRIVEGACADLVLFDAARIRDIATYEAPQRFSEGIRTVMVNGALAWEDGSDGIERAGRVLRSR